jgi:hypothetical protein
MLFKVFNVIIVINNHRYNKKYNVTKHLKFVHSVNIYRCDHCYYLSRCKGQLKVHFIKTHLHDVKFTYQCTKCDRSFMNNVNLKNHEENVHINSKIKSNLKSIVTYTCCNAVFTSYEISKT